MQLLHFSASIAFCWRSENSHAVLSASKPTLMVCIVGIQSKHNSKIFEMNNASDGVWLVPTLILIVFMLLIWLAHANQQKIKKEELKVQQAQQEIQRIIDSGKDTLAIVERLRADAELQYTTPQQRRRREQRQERAYYSKTHGEIGKYEHDGSRYVIFDLETTGLNPAVHSIIEIAAVKYVDDEPVETFETLVRLPPKKKISKEITELTGITLEMLERDGIEIKEAMQKFIHFIGEERIMSYNFDFDGDFLAAANGGELKNKSRCIYKMAKSKWKNRGSYKLVDLLETECMTKATNAHRAMRDVEYAHDLLITIAYY